jgi:hypothetical protein
VVTNSPGRCLLNCGSANFIFETRYFNSRRRLSRRVFVTSCGLIQVATARRNFRVLALRFEKPIPSCWGLRTAFFTVAAR